MNHKLKNYLNRFGYHVCYQKFSRFFTTYEYKKLIEYMNDMNASYTSLLYFYTSLTFVHYNLEHGLAIVTQSFVSTRSELHNFPVKVQIRSDMTIHTIPDTVYLVSVLNWVKLVCTGYSLNWNICTWPHSGVECQSDPQ